MADSATFSGISGDLKTQIEQLLLLLSERERYVVERRFSLDDLERATLEEIGQYFDVTRERIRQIEKNALQKLRRNVGNVGAHVVNDAAYDKLQASGGVMREDEMISKLLSSEGSNYSLNALRFLLSLDARFDRLQNTIKLAPYFRLKGFSESMIQQMCTTIMRSLKENGSVLPLTELRKKLMAKNEAFEIINEQGLEALCKVHKDFKCVDGGAVGLMAWKHIHPRTLRDKIYYVLRLKNEPLHFVDIANWIMSEQFDQKSVNLQAVHNELIRHDDFILIGRGTYALQEWGYSSGTVADVIQDILEKKGQMAEDKIIEAVLKRRKVKPITIVLNLKNKPQFVRTGRKMYTLKK